MCGMNLDFLGGLLEGIGPRPARRPPRARAGLLLRTGLNSLTTATYPTHPRAPISGAGRRQQEDEGDLPPTLELVGIPGEQLRRPARARRDDRS